MELGDIQKNIISLIDNFSKEDFIFDLLLAYGSPKSTIKRIKSGDKNKLDSKGELEQQRKLFFKVVENNLYSTIDKIKNGLKNKKTDPRFIIVTNYDKFLAYDTKIDDTLDIDLSELYKNYDFFLPWIGIEKVEYQDENIADIKAADKLVKLYDEIAKNNEHEIDEDLHALNIFLSRLLFCYFAEDTKIFKENQFTNFIASHTKESGEDVKYFLEKLFTVFNQKNKESDLMECLKLFPYVNGNLFAKEYSIPKFTSKSRRMLIEIGSLNWSEINPDIFGSMMQSVVDPDKRSSLGMHYTSVSNIMKLINPLFLSDLKNEFEQSKGNNKKLKQLQVRLSKIKFFDPACGSGNFLIIAYKEIKKIEIDIIKEMGIFALSMIKLSQFYGIEIDDFAHETAKLSLYLAEHQMNILFLEEIGLRIDPLPLKNGGNIVCGNASRLDWIKVCPRDKEDEVYILGNPPYLGSRNQDKEQKDDMKFVFKKDYKSLDYIAIWFYKGAEYIRCFNVRYAFVSTNSISQGEQVSLMWPRVLKNDLEICFAHKSFKWQNNAKGNANVIVVIIGISNLSTRKKYLYAERTKQEVNHINSYLSGASSIYITKRSKPLSEDFNKIIYGSLLNDKGYLVLSKEDMDFFVKKYPITKKFIRKYIGAKEFLNGGERYCFYIQDSQLSEALKIPEIEKKLKQVTEARQNSSERSTRKMASFPNQFYFKSHKETDSIIIPRSSSERRNYIPIGFLHKDTIISDAAQALYDAEHWIFGVITSRMHMVWMRSVAGRLKTDYRYSSALVYNTFPFPKILQIQKDEITKHVYNILDEREKHSEKTLAELYDPDKIPEGLKFVHSQLDFAIEKIYRSKPFESDEERLEYLFKLYEKMIDEEKNNNKK